MEIKGEQAEDSNSGQVTHMEMKSEQAEDSNSGHKQRIRTVGLHQSSSQGHRRLCPAIRSFSPLSWRLKRPRPGSS
jgi:hypothetical protein